MFVEQSLLLSIMRPLQSCLLKKLDRTIEPEASINPVELHSFEIYTRVTEIENTFQSLQIALNGIKNVSESAAPRIDHYRYHLENYHLRLIGIHDRACRLTGFCIGIETVKTDRPMKNNDVFKRLKFNGMHGIHAALSDVKSLIEPFRKMRNRIAHESELSLDWMNVFDALPQIKTKAVGIDPSLLLVNFIQNEMTSYAQLFRELVASINQLIKELSPYFLAKKLL